MLKSSFVHPDIAPLPAPAPPVLRAIGVVNKAAVMNANGIASKVIEVGVAVPGTTTTAQPWLNGFVLGFGQAVLNADGSLSMSGSRSRQFGRGAVTVFFDRFLEPLPPSTEKTAVIKIVGLLQEAKKDREWFALAVFTVLLFTEE